MLINEFETRTGFYPCEGLYNAINAAYNKYDGDKDAFCKEYVLNTNGIAAQIQRTANLNQFSEQKQLKEEINQLKEKLHSYQEKINELTKKLDHELEWQPYISDDNVSQSDYLSLQKAAGTKVLTVDEAKDILYQWYGFAREKITILYNVPVYQINRHKKLRKTGELSRLPLYNSTDWNYIRFNCGSMMYELYNDNLFFFFD